MTKYIWISVAGASYEPAMKKNGKVYTIGCPDPLEEDTFEIWENMDSYPLTPPKTPEEQKKFEKRRPKPEHGYMEKGK